MRKHSKFITILLSTLLAVCLMQTVFVQAFAAENSATPDEPKPISDLCPVSMEVVKAPSSVMMIDYRVTDSNFWKNVVIRITYNDGKTFDVNCKDMYTSYEVTPPYAKIKGYKGSIGAEVLDFTGDVANIKINYDYGVDKNGNSKYISTKLSAKKKVDPHTIVKCELTKLPSKIFTAPLTEQDLKYEFGSAYRWENIVAKNIISENMAGAEVTYYYANGEKGTVVLTDDMKWGVPSNFVEYYTAYSVDKYRNNVSVYVNDIGNYQATISFQDDDHPMVMTVKSTYNLNPPLPSANIKSATSDVATKDNAGNNNSTNGTANNGVVATGNFATPAIIATVMILAAAVMFVLKRKHSF